MNLVVGVFSLHVAASVFSLLVAAGVLGTDLVVAEVRGLFDIA